MSATPLGLEEAQRRLLELARPLLVERVDIPSALGRYLAEPLVAKRTQPGADCSAMDGYAVASTDGAGPWRVIGESAAGRPFVGIVAAGEAIRIATGALIPDGINCVIIQEDTSRTGDSIALSGSLPPIIDQHVRRFGNDFHTNAKLLDAGTRIGPAQIALALMAGHSHVSVRRRPSLSIIDGGDELVADPEDCAPHQLPASNGAMIAALAASVPCLVERMGPVPDRMEAWASALDKAAHADIIVTSGGASVGDHDLVRPALEAWGAKLEFWRVAIKPGKPLLIATKGHQIVVGLPGNPVSSYVTALLFVLPLLRALSGAAHCLPRRVSSLLTGELPAGGQRQEFLRAIWDGARVTPATPQNSGALAVMATCNVLIDRPAHSPLAEPGSVVELYLLDNGSFA